MKIFALICLLFSTLLLLRMGILPLIYFGRHYGLSRLLFWLSFILTCIFSLSTAYIVTYLVSLDWQ